MPDFTAGIGMVQCLACVIIAIRLSLPPPDGRATHLYYANHYTKIMQTAIRNIFQNWCRIFQ